MLTVLWVFTGAGFTAFLSRVAWRSGPATQVFESLQSQLRNVDLAAFQNLSDASDQQFLRRQVNASDFRKVQHLRVRAMMSYLLAVGHNAAIFIRLGEVARHSPDRQVAEAGQQLIQTALETRILVLRIYPRLLTVWLFPKLASVDIGPIISRYDLLSGGLMQLLRLQQPSKIANIAAFS